MGRDPMPPHRHKKGRSMWRSVLAIVVVLVASPALGAVCSYTVTSGGGFLCPASAGHTACVVSSAKTGSCQTDLRCTSTLCSLTLSPKGGPLKACPLGSKKLVSMNCYTPKTFRVLPTRTTTATPVSTSTSTITPTATATPSPTPTDTPPTVGSPVDLEVTAQFGGTTGPGWGMTHTPLGSTAISIFRAQCNFRNNTASPLATFTGYSHWSVIGTNGTTTFAYVDGGSNPGEDVQLFQLSPPLMSGATAVLHRDFDQPNISILGYQTNRVCLRCWVDPDGNPVNNCSAMWFDCAASDGICRTGVTGVLVSASLSDQWVAPWAPDGCQCPTPFPTDPAGLAPTPTATP